MPTNPNDAAKDAFEAGRRRLEQLEAGTLREVGEAYAGARERIRRRLLDLWLELKRGRADDEAVVLLARDARLLGVIEAELAEIEGLLGERLRRDLGAADGLGLEMVLDETRTMARVMKVALPDLEAVATGIDRRAVLMVDEAVNYWPTLRQATAKTLALEMRTAMIAGEGVPELVERVLGVANSAWARGETSATLFVRRQMIEVYNASKEEMFATVKEQSLPTLQKQAIATISGRTTVRCLDVHGQVREIGEMFELTGSYSGFAGKKMHPPFHWGCRTSEAAYMEEFDEDSSYTTGDMRSMARAEKNKRRGK